MTFDNFKITKLSFSLNKKFKKKTYVKINSTIATARSYNKTKKILTIFLKVSLTSGDVPFFFEVEGIGQFTFKETPNEKTIQQLSTINCPAIIFPYIRETIADITRRSGFSPLHLPPVNFVALAKTIKKPNA